jgi:hypothetical protein
VRGTRGVASDLTPGRCHPVWHAPAASHHLQVWKHAGSSCVNMNMHIFSGACLCWLCSAHTGGMPSALAAPPMPPPPHPAAAASARAAAAAAAALPLPPCRCAASSPAPLRAASLRRQAPCNDEHFARAPWPEGRQRTSSQHEDQAETACKCRMLGGCSPCLTGRSGRMCGASLGGTHTHQDDVTCVIDASKCVFA